LSHHTPQTVGQNFVYSNLGFGLLGGALSNYKNTAFRILIHDHILKPLELKHTYFDVPKAEESHLAKGSIGTPSQPLLDFNVMDASGARNTNIRDLEQI